MSTPIERAREKLWAAAPKLYAKGLRRDFTLTLRRVDPAANPLSMDPADTVEQPGLSLAVPAPDVKAYSALQMAMIAQALGGNFEISDYRIQLPRAAAVEDFLASVADPDGDGMGGPYPEMGRLLFDVNGQPCKPVRWEPRPLILRIYVRKIAR